VGELLLHRYGELPRHIGIFNFLQDLEEETKNYKAPGLQLRNSAGLQVEQLLVIETPGGACVTSTLNVSGFDFEVRDRVGSCSFAENKISVLFVGIRANSVGSYQDVTYPHGASTAAVKSALIVHPRNCLRPNMVHIHPMFVVLGGIREIRPQ
jgi:hypothetical protein